ncbi:putative undecaprenyl-diphosphatase [Mycobacterium xenopi 4042]|uniref:Putative undecaprenyl-diphosphatase n=1 Tax=Mycobacterium xenopi 4042 TaxID=1299334 RepID=X8BF13_MYCXE|nr:putative undecaprenyl-diphosphatase [Mycobacterium xenopi 4042]
MSGATSTTGWAGTSSSAPFRFACSVWSSPTKSALAHAISGWSPRRCWCFRP